MEDQRVKIEVETPAPDSGVVSIFNYREHLRYPVLKDLEAYWNSIKGDRLVPARADINPRAIEDMLEYAFVAEHIAPGIARLRLAGMHLNELMGMEVRGMPLTALIAPEYRRVFSDAVEAVFEGPEIVWITLAGQRAIGKPAMDAKIVFLPMRAESGDVTRVLGALVPHGVVGQAPRRFDVLVGKMRSLSSQDDEAVRVDAKAAVGADVNPDISSNQPDLPKARVYGHLSVLNFDE